MKVEYVQNLDDEDIRRVCAEALADIETQFAVAKDRRDARAMRRYKREFADVANFQRKYLGILFRRDDGMVWDPPSEARITELEGYDKILAGLNGAEICPFCGSLVQKAGD